MNYQTPKALELGGVEKLTLGPRLFTHHDGTNGFYFPPPPEVRPEPTDLDEIC